MTSAPPAARVRSSVLVARTLIDEYEVALGRMVGAWRAEDDAERDVVRAEVDRVYNAIWEQLDVAAAATRDAGRATEAYRAVRASPDLVLGAGVLGSHEHTEHLRTEHKLTKTVDVYRSTLELHTNRRGVQLARDACAALEGIWPELDWHDASAAEPVPDLRPSGAGARLVRWAARTFGKKA